MSESSDGCCPTTAHASTLVALTSIVLASHTLCKHHTFQKGINTQLSSHSCTQAKLVISGLFPVTRSAEHSHIASSYGADCVQPSAHSIFNYPTWWGFCCFCICPCCCSCCCPCCCCCCHCCQPDRANKAAPYEASPAPADAHTAVA